MKIQLRYKGGAGSGNRGHKGIPGHLGGSAPSGGGSTGSGWTKDSKDLTGNTKMKRVEVTFSNGRTDTVAVYVSHLPTTEGYALRAISRERAGDFRNAERRGEKPFLKGSPNVKKYAEPHYRDGYSYTYYDTEAEAMADGEKFINWIKNSK